MWSVKGLIGLILPSSFAMSTPGRLLGVYTPVDPSIYSPVYPANPYPKVREIASLMTELFDLFIDMRYLPASSVSFPPHEHLPLDLTEPARYGVSKDVVDLWQMIPYRNEYSETNWNFGSDHGEFLNWGEFLSDLRGSWDMNGTWWRTIVEPFYGLDDLDPESPFRARDADERGWDHEHGPYMRPWYATLSDIGNHGSVLVLDTKTWDMWLLDQLSGSSTDPAFRERPGEGRLDDRQLTNEFDLRQYPSRPAVDFLRDIIKRFRTLEWIPGGLYEPEPEDYEEKFYNSYKSLYQECGWPDKFNPLLFDKLAAEGGLKYRYDGESAQGATKTAESYEPLDDLYRVMVAERSIIEDRIRLVDARYRLAHDQLSRHERRGLEATAQAWQEDISPPAKRWSDDQARLRIELDFIVSDLEALRTQTGRYAGPGWAGVSGEALTRLYDDRRSAEELRTSRLEALIKDEDLETRLQRQYNEVKLAAAAVTEETWQAFADSHETRKLNPPEEQWVILGRGTWSNAIKRVLDEDMELDELRKEIVYAFEIKEDRSWAGKRKWKNKEGVVAMADLGDLDQDHSDEL